MPKGIPRQGHVAIAAPVRETNDAQLFAQSAHAPGQTGERSQLLHCQNDLTALAFCHDASFSWDFAGGTPIPTGDKRGSPVPPYSYRSASMGSTEAALATLRGRAFLVVGLSVSGRTTRAGQRRSSLATIRGRQLLESGQFRGCGGRGCRSLPDRARMRFRPNHARLGQRSRQNSRADLHSPNRRHTDEARFCICRESFGAETKYGRPPMPSKPNAAQRAVRALKWAIC